MSRTWIYARDGRVFERGSPEWEAYLNERRSGAPMIAKDEGEFLSPIDGRVYSGRAGMREHNKRHDVVNWRDCKGLPQEMPKEAPKGVREAVIEAAKSKGYLNGQ
jgi:hypothetical protein